jgi:O-methyltransferase domain
MPLSCEVSYYLEDGLRVSLADLCGNSRRRALGVGMSASIEDNAAAPVDGVLPLWSLMQLVYQQWRSPAVYAATELGVADVLGDGSCTVAEVAEATGCHAPSLYRLLRALARIGVFVELDGRRFANSALSQLLRADVSGSVSAMVGMTAGLMRGALGELVHSVRTGQPSFERAYGMPMWRYLTEYNPEAGAQFNAAMAQASTAVNPSIAHAADLSGARSVVDVGGGHGGLARTMLACHPDIECAIVFDQPHVIDQLRATGDPPPEGRLQLVGGDFFSAVPASADVYVMKWILHDWDDAACVRLLATCRRAMTPHSRLLAIDLVIDSDRSDELAYALDLQMLVALGGQERTAAEFTALYDAAGLRLTRIIPTASMYCLIEGIPQGNERDSS